MDDLFNDGKWLYPRPTAPLAILLVAGLFALGGCAMLEAALDRVCELEPPSAGELTTNEVPETVTADGVEFARLSWDWGGFNGSGATLVQEAQIGSLSVSASGLRYSWVSGGCEALDAANSHENANCIAALFVLDGTGTWRGGKFDWISTDRLTRDFKNISGAYNGWPPGAVKTAKAYAFVIVSKDGKRRTNVAFCEGMAK